MAQSCPILCDPVDYTVHGVTEAGTPEQEICMQVRKQQLGLDIEQQTGSKLGKEYVKAVFVTLLI